MRAAHLFAGVMLSALITGVVPAAAQSSGATGCQAARPLGVARTIEVDAARGPRFGHQQYKDLNVLNDREVILTFDDGPLRPYTRPVLDALDAHCTRATFFMVGRMAAADPEMVKEVARRGHTVANHTWSHRNLRTANAGAQRQEIELGVSMVRRTAGVPIAPFFRFPYLSDPQGAQQYLAGRNIAMFSIEVDSNDYRTKDPQIVHRNVMNQLVAQGKGIILFHDIQPSTAGALRRLLDDLAAGRKVKVGPQIDRHMAAPEGGPTTLIEPSLYEGNRTFTRVEAPPPPPPAAAGSPSGATVPAGTPAPAATAPKPEDIRPPTPASAATDAQKAAAEKKDQAKGAVLDAKAKTETNITRATPDGVKEKASVSSADDANKTKK